MQRSEIADLLARHRALFQRHDAPGLALQHSPDGTFESPASGIVAGRGAIEEVYRYWFTAFPDMEFTWEEPAIDDDRASFFWTLTGTATGPFYGMSGKGGRVAVKGAADYRFTETGIWRARHIFDFSSLLIATGVLKAKPA
jgi:hypothetical protein